MSEAARLYIGEDRFVVREKIMKDLKEHGHIVKIEDYTNKVGYSQRTDEVIEPRISLQWFMKMKDLAKPALELVENDRIRFYPSKYKNMYRNWMENVTDWCISRQLWWGHRIPAYYLPDGEIIVAKTKEEAFEIAKSAVRSSQSAVDSFNSPVHQFTTSPVSSKNTEIKIGDLKQDEDVLDTWFSSWLWPISVFDGIRHPDNPDIKYYYPTTALITAPDIIFFWVARMIMAGWEYRKDIPFRDVYFTGMVRDKQGRKMSKSLGNSPEPLDLIANYGADAVRVGMLLCSPAGNDLLFDESLIGQGRNFCNKIWNALRLVKGWIVDEKIEQSETNKISVEWFHAALNQAMTAIDDQLEKYRLSEALMSIYKLVWDDFCSWYLEMIKPGYQEPVDKTTYDRTIKFFDGLVRLLHPFMPFITEELWQTLNDREPTKSVMFAPSPVIEEFNADLIEKFGIAEEVITTIRNIRKEKNIPFRDSINLSIRKNFDEQPDLTFDCVVVKLCNLAKLDYVEVKPPDSITFIVRTTEFYIPLIRDFDKDAEIRKLEDELQYAKGFLDSVMKKLANNKFVDGAPAKVVDSERKKQADALSKIKVLEEQLKEMTGRS